MLLTSNSDMPIHVQLPTLSTTINPHPPEEINLRCLNPSGVREKQAPNIGSKRKSTPHKNQ